MSDSDDLPPPSLLFSRLTATPRPAKPPPAPASTHNSRPSTSPSASPAPPPTTRPTNSKSPTTRVSLTPAPENPPRPAPRRSPRLSPETARTAPSPSSFLPPSSTAGAAAPDDSSTTERHRALALELFPPSPPPASTPERQIDELAGQSARARETSPSVIEDFEVDLPSPTEAQGHVGRERNGGGARKQGGVEKSGLGSGGLRIERQREGECAIVVSDSEDDRRQERSPPPSPAPAPGPSLTKPSISASRTPKATTQSRRRITISLAASSSSSSSSESESEFEPTSPPRTPRSRAPEGPKTLRAKRNGSSSREGEKTFVEEEVVVVETDDEDEGQVLEPSALGASGLGGRNMDDEDVLEHDGILLYEPTPKKRPVKLSRPTPSPSPSPFLVPPPSKPFVPSRARSSSPTKPNNEVDTKEKRDEIDLTASSSSEEDDAPRPPARRSIPSTPSTKARPRPSPASSSTPTPAPKSRAAPKPKSTSKPTAAPPAPPAAASSVPTLSAAERGSLPLTLIRQLDRLVFRKRWDGLRCLDPEGEYGGPGLPDGIEVVWNGRLRNTAGRARWKTVKSSSGGPATHQTTIELATKVTDTEPKLRHTLAHELCHVAAWVLSGELKPPHGAAFKLWAARIMKVRPDIEVTTTHSYQIVYTHRWQCEKAECGKIFGRFSNSINPSTHGCPCGSRLVAIDKDGNVKKPRVTVVVDDEGRTVETPGKKRNGWIEFLAVQSPLVRKDQPSLPQSEILKVVAERWKVAKQATVTATNDSREAGGGRGGGALADAMQGLKV
ncbi:hypothetical protein JCM5296_003638 [Sporobolomyces johnsonii]